MTYSLKAVVLRDRKIVAISGTDRVKFLQGLTTNDIRRLAPDKALYAGFLTGQGKLLCDAFVMQDGDRILIDIATGLVEDFVKRLSAFKLRAAVEIGEAAPALAVAAVWGPGATARLELDSAEGIVGNSALAKAHLAFVDPRIAALGARLIYPADVPIEAELARLGFASATAAHYAEHRLALGIADTAEIGGEVCYPLEANFEMLHGVDFKKGCYLGQELTARMKLKGELRKRILPVSSSALLPTAGTTVTADGTQLGPLIAASGRRGLALLRLDRLADAREDSIRVQDVPINIHWPDWLPR
ncbi:folate-binding protein YgfZ [Bradyrhizobium sp. AUGA SZCCT0283]|uniref:CAF17-like 4Fe-4S cluster assembly/insertion protein YgfZ n=1 Tax=Bradyrhizobium sp. AUGA SZCCT0283 TaxID=2807671 RepID=UPI001BA7C525|nr:folate-binding protein YgfZ [Bradyrhizobium sp. AUGA SZCCT0283]MBR1279338.1 folate-binding protein YgfZ [Bradyrhizobium sp. AUGA SZCCT0283]